MAARVIARGRGKNRISIDREHDPLSRAASPFGLPVPAAWTSRATPPRGVLEVRERLEQLRALEAGMAIAVSLIDPRALGVQVDTPADLARARALAAALPAR